MSLPRALVSNVSDVSAPLRLIALADRLRSLGPSHRDPERFHIDKSEIEAELRLLARRITHG
jgi:hypothetical protein